MDSRLCVFCGSSPGASPGYAEAARALAAAMARKGAGLVYGGASVGVMGALADAALAHGLEVDGVIPGGLVEREVAHAGLTRLHVVDSMHERKRRMADLADAFVALPGGLGTLEELFEVWTWALLGIHAKPVALLDVGSYWAPLLAFLDGAVAAGFVRPAHRAMLLVDDDPDRLLDRLASYEPPEVRRWGPSTIDRRP
jgi:uncharacterized protein (TIGR00730 family)